MPPPAGRFLVGFDATSPFDWTPTWTRLDTNSLVASYTIDRGRQFELDRTDVGRATVTINDVDGVLDPTNPSGPYYNKIEPLLPAMIGRRNPITGVWWTRFRGFIEEYDYTVHPSQQFNQLTVSLVDLFEVLEKIEMVPGKFGTFGTLAHDFPSGHDDEIWLAHLDLPGVTANPTMKDRIDQLLDQAGVPTNFRVVFTGNVRLQFGFVSAGESVMSAIQEAADGEFPGVSNVYVDRQGRLNVHGRLAKFTPGTIAAGSGGQWNWGTWNAGDGAALTASPGTYAHIRRLAVNRGLSKIINSAYATPRDPDPPWTPAELAGQHVDDTASITTYGIRSWSAQNLWTWQGQTPPITNALQETKRFADYYVANYKGTPSARSRVSEIEFRTVRPGSPSDGINWSFLTEVDISDQMSVTVGMPGGGGLSNELYFVEGIHEQAGPLVPEYDDVTMSLDLSPQAYFLQNPWGDT